MRKAVLCGVLALGLLVGARAVAHEGGTDARGVVKAITADELVVTTTAGAELKVAIVAGTEIQRGRAQIHAADVRPGERVVVHAATRAGHLEAMLVKVAADKR
jgi:hypothetical protein